MLLIILALFWVALLSPIVVRRLRDRGSERSIESFHAEHEVLSRQDYSVAPAHRLDRPDEIVASQSATYRPRLTVVHADDTFSTLESRASWDEWSDDYEYDEHVAENSNRYARAYASHPEPVDTRQYQPPIRRRSMRSQRRMFFSSLILAALVVSVAAYVSGSSLVTDLAALAWLSVIVYVALAFYAVSQGYLNDTSLPLRLPKRRQLASIEPLYRGGERDEPRYESQYEEFDSEFYEPESEVQWYRGSERQRAFG